MEPNADTIKEGLNLLKSFASRKTGNEEICKVIQMHSKLWAEAVVFASRLMSGNHVVKEQKNVDNPVKFCKEGGGLDTLHAIVMMRTKLLETVKKLSELEVSSDSGSSDSLKELLGMSLPENWLSELHVEAFDDIVSSQAAEHHKFIASLKKTLQSEMQNHLEKKKAENPLIDPDTDYFHELGPSGPQCWKKNLAEDATFEATYDQAKQTVMTVLPALAMKQFADSFIKVGQ